MQPIATVLNLIGPDKLKELADIISAGIMTEIDMDAVLKVCITLVAFYGSGMILSLIQNLIMASVTKVTKNLRRIYRED